MQFNNTKDLLLHLKFIKEKKGVSNKDLAIKLNRSESSVSELLSRSNISINKLNDLCKALDCYMDITFIEKESDTK